MSETARRWISPEEYLALEEQAEYKSEYFHGEVFAMAGGTPNHNLISGNVLFTLKTQLRGRGCFVFPSDQRIKIPETGLYTYSDVAVTCGELTFDGPGRTELVNPTVIVEVLSDSTEAYDRGDKFEQYQRLASLRDYVLVASHKRRIECFSRRVETNDWTLASASGMDEVVAVPSIGCILSLAEVYDGIEFADPSPRRKRANIDGP
jgi:Uma2 family endonuclease